MRHDYTNKHWQLDMEGPKKPWIKWIRIAIIVIILLILVSFLTQVSVLISRIVTGCLRYYPGYQYGYLES